MANTRVKVRRETLIAKLEGERQRMIDRGKRDQETYEAARQAWLEKLAAACEDFAALARSDPDKAVKRTDHYYRSGSGYGTEVHFGTLTYPDKPSKASVGKIDRMLAVLRVADDETISIAAEDEYAAYL